MNSEIGPIALLGTSADPPTCGHQALLCGLLNLFPRVVTWASDNPSKEHLTSLETRHQLLDALVVDIDNPRLKLIQDLSSPWTITTLERASQLWPMAELIFVVGSDLAGQIPTWTQAQDLLRLARVGIAPREGWPIKKTQINTLQALGGRIDLLPLKTPPTASSIIRKKPKLSQIPAAIVPILEERNLYGLKTSSQ